MALGAAAFAWFVQRSIITDDQRPLAEAAVEIAGFPTTAKAAIVELARILSGKPDYRSIRATPPDRLPSDFHPVVSKIKGVGEGLVVRRGPGTPAYGWRMIAGVLRINGSLQTAAVLLSPDLEIVHYWPLIEDGQIGVEYQAPLRKLPHGVAVLHDGSVIYVFDGGFSLHKKDRCGRTIWALPGRFHHSVTPDDADKTVWTFRYDGERDDPPELSKVLQIATDDGAIVREFSITDIIAANPNIDVLELRRYHLADKWGNDKGKVGQWLKDPVHLNDADPLPRALADKFPMFAPGDLLMSAREINLLFVLDPTTLAIKWWLVGATMRQHDGDWNADGRLSVFNNRTTRGYSQITTIDPVTYATSVAVDGQGIDFYGRRRGDHQRLPNGDWLVVSAQQGRIFEVSPQGELALEFYNEAPEEGLGYTMLSASSFFPAGTLKPDAFQCDK